MRPGSLPLWISATFLLLGCGGGGGSTTVQPPPPASVWTSLAQAPTGSRGAVAFAVDGAAYVVTGSGTRDTDPNAKVWKYDPGTNTWTTRRAFPGMASLDGTAFAVGGKGYVVFGHNNSDTNLVETRECWEYTPSTDAWTRKRDFPGRGRAGTGAVVLGQTAYCYTGTGTGGWAQPSLELWAYDAVADTWTRKTDGPVGSFLPPCFAAGGKAYFVMGDGGQRALLEYNPATDTWARRRTFHGAAGWGALGFGLGTKGYVCSGATAINPTVSCHEVWEYDTITDTWTRKPDTEAPGRVMANGFVLGERLYLGLGASPSGVNHADLWCWRP